MKKLGNNLFLIPIILILLGLILQAILSYVTLHNLYNAKIIYHLLRTLGFISLGLLLAFQTINISQNKITFFEGKRNIKLLITIALFLAPIFLIYVYLGLPYPAFLTHFVAYYIYDSRSLFYDFWCVITGFYGLLINFKSSKD